MLEQHTPPVVLAECFGCEAGRVNRQHGKEAKFHLADRIGPSRAQRPTARAPGAVRPKSGPAVFRPSPNRVRPNWRSAVSQQFSPTRFAFAHIQNAHGIKSIPTTCNEKKAEAATTYSIKKPSILVKWHCLRHEMHDAMTEQTFGDHTNF